MQNVFLLSSGTGMFGISIINAGNGAGMIITLISGLVLLSWYMYRVEFKIRKDNDDVREKLGKEIDAIRRQCDTERAELMSKIDANHDEIIDLKSKLGVLKRIVLENRVEISEEDKWVLE